MDTVTPSKPRGQHRPHNYANVVYASEARAKRRGYPNGQEGIGQGAALALVRRVTSDSAWTHGEVEVRFYRGGEGSGWARGAQTHRGRTYTNRISLSTRGEGLTADVVLHELAHIATPKDPAHGRAFRVQYLQLLDDHDPRFARALRAAFKWYGAYVGPAR